MVGGWGRFSGLVAASFALTGCGLDARLGSVRTPAPAPAPPPPTESAGDPGASANPDPTIGVWQDSVPAPAVWSDPVDVEVHFTTLAASSWIYIGGGPARVIFGDRRWEVLTLSGVNAILPAGGGTTSRCAGISAWALAHHHSFRIAGKATRDAQGLHFAATPAPRCGLDDGLLPLTVYILTEPQMVPPLSDLAVMPTISGRVNGPGEDNSASQRQVRLVLYGYGSAACPILTFNKAGEWIKGQGRYEIADPANGVVDALIETITGCGY